MKAVIVTVYNSHNSGSFLQAYALQTFLRKNGIDVSFLRREDMGSHDIKRVLKNFITLFANLKFGEAWQTLKIWFIYDKTVNRLLSICDQESTFFKEAEYIILGSDTIWNFTSHYFLRNANTYLGYSFSNKKIISYAASAANTSIEKFKSVIDKHGGLSHLSEILVRDSYTKRLVENSTCHKAKIVTDPTLLLDKNDYHPLVKEIDGKYTPYLFLYYFGNISIELQKQIILFAQIKHLKIISMPFKRKWCDLNLTTSPYDMVSYFYYAKCVITNTFHGCALSLLYEKPFAVHDEGKNKVSEFLNAYGESQRLFTIPNSFPEALDKVASSCGDGIYNQIRKKSQKSLLAALNLGK